MTDLLCRHRADTLDDLFRQHHVVVWHDDSGGRVGGDNLWGYNILDTQD